MNKVVKRRVVVIGGGNGSMLAIDALKQNLGLFAISAVIAMSDSGGSSGRLRAEYDTTPPGDIMRAILAMSQYDSQLLKEIFNKHRFFGGGKLDGHNLGNVFLVWAEQYAGDKMSAIRALEEALSVVGHAYPCTEERTHLLAQLANGSIIKTEAVIDRPAYDRSHRIQKVWLEPSVSGDAKAISVIEQADYIIFGPGSLYCSVVATLLPIGIREAIGRSRAQLVFVAGNAYELEGEAGPTTLSDFVRELEQYLPRPLDLVIYNNHPLTAEQQKYYDEKKWGTIGFDPEKIPSDRKIIAQPFEKENGGLSTAILGGILSEFLL